MGSAGVFANKWTCNLGTKDVEGLIGTVPLVYEVSYFMKGKDGPVWSNGAVGQFASKPWTLGNDAKFLDRSVYVTAPVVGKPKVTPPAAPADGKKKKAKRHSCGQGAMHLVIGA